MTISQVPLVPDSAWQMTLAKTTRHHMIYDYSYPVAPEKCPVCGAKLLVRRRMTRTYTSVPSGDKEVVIRVRRQVYSCMDAVCNRIYMDASPPGLSKHHNITQLLENKIADACRTGNNKSVAQEFGVDEKVVRSIRKEYGIPAFLRGKHKPIFV